MTTDASVASLSSGMERERERDTTGRPIIFSSWGGELEGDSFFSILVLPPRPLDEVAGHSTVISFGSMMGVESSAAYARTRIVL